ncbi:MAG TPA: hypothetical protein VJH22_03490 [Candidatus Nanoarchaeia archaeon]|nr:hypothetical protein [Candidatus Nanoarchaeia archaeon]
MKPSIALPPELQRLYDEIDSAYSKVSDDWEKYNDHIIPEDQVLARKILGFLIEVVKYIEANPSKIKVNEWLEFLSKYYYQFYYGPGGDDRNYLDFDEVNLRDILDIDYDVEMSNAEIKILKKLLIEARKKFVVSPAPKQ